MEPLEARQLLTGSPIYVEDTAWTGLAYNDPIVDADFVTPGNQPANYLVNAFSTIQEGIDAVDPGGTVVVNNGTYTESVDANNGLLIDHNLSIVAGSATLDAEAAFTGIKINSGTTATISGITVNNFGSTGIEVAGSLNLATSTVDGGLTGIYVNGGTLVMDDSTVENAGIFGVQVAGASGLATISDSEILNNSTAGVIASTGTANVTTSIINGSNKGLLINAGGSGSVTKSNLDGNIRGVENATANVVNASGNYWGVGGEAFVSSKALGLVDFSPYLESGSDGPAVGFQGDFSHVHVTTLGSQSGSTGRVQEGVNLIADGLLFTGANRVVDLNPGTYVDEVTVDRALKLQGAKVGQDARSRAQTAESIIVPSQSAPDPDTAPYPVLIYVTANNVTIDGLTLDGDNPALTSGVLLNGADIDAEEGIASYEGVGGISAKNNIIRNTSYTGIDFYNYYNGGAPTTGSVISQNLIENLGAFDWGIGILVYNNFYADITENKIYDVRTGIQTGNYNLADPGSSHDITNNDITARRTGIFYNLHYQDATPFVVSTNTVAAINDASISKWDGIAITSQQSNVSATASGNIIDGSAANPSTNTTGYTVWNTPTSGSVTISGGTVSGVDKGVWVNNYEGYSSDGDDTHATIDGVTITAALIGVYVLDSPSNTNGSSVSATITNDTSITTGGGGVGVQVSGADASATITDNDASIFNNTTGIDVDGGAATIINNHIYGNGTGIAAHNGAKLRVESNDLTGNTVRAIFVETGAKVDAGGGASLATGLGTSLGLNDLSGYDGLTSFAIVDNNLVSGPDSDVYALLNNFGVLTPPGIEQILIDDTDNPAYTQVIFSSFPAVTPPAIVYVDDNWIGTGSGVDADAGGPGTAFGYDEFSNIQDAIDAVAVSGTVVVYAGTYKQNVVVNKSVEIAGAGQGLTNVYPAAADPEVNTETVGGSLAGSPSNVFLVRASDVNIHDLTVDGDNTSLTSGIVRGSADVDARNGIITDYNAGTFNNLHVHDVTVQNVYLRGIYFTDGTGFHFDHNTVHNVRGSASSIAIFNFGGSGIIEWNNVDTSNDAIATNWSTGTQILNNTVLSSGSGIHSDNNFSSGDVIQDNNVSAGTAGSYGIFVFAPYVPVLVKGNQVSGVEVGLGAFGSGAPASTVTFDNNTVDLTGQGPTSIGAWVSTTLFGFGSANVAADFVNDNDISNAGAGILVEQELGYTAIVNVIGNDSSIHGNAIGIDVNGGNATISGNHIYDNSVAGIRYTNGATGSVSANYFNDTIDNATDLRLDSTAGSVSIGAGNDFAGETYFIDNRTAQAYDLTGIATSDQANPFDIADRIYDALDDASSGLIRYNGVNLYVSTPSSGASDETIQRAVNAASAGDIINVDVGTFNENVSIPLRLTLLGAGSGSTIINSVAANTPVIDITSTGDNASDRLVIQGVQVTGASGPSGNSTSGIRVAGGSSTGFYTFDDVASVGNAGHGIGFDQTGTLTDVVISNSNLSNNSGSGARFPSSLTSLTGLSVTGTQMNNNNVIGLSLNPSITPGFSATGIVISTSSFANNGDGVSVGEGDISLLGFNGTATLTDVTITTDSHIGLQLRGAGALAPSGSVILTNVTLNGTPAVTNPGSTPTGIYIANYTDVSAIQFNDVDINVTGAGVAGLVVDTAGTATLDINDTEFGPTTGGYIGDASPTPIDARDATFNGVTALAASTAQAYAIVDKIVDGIDIPTLGLVRLKTNQVYVTPISIFPPFTTTPSIQRAVDAASSGDTVHIQAGSYTGSVTTTGKAITFSPGDSPGQVTLNGSLTLDNNDALTMEINGTSAATQYDNFVVNGAVTLGGATINASRGFNPSIGSTFTLVNNDAADAVTGTFAGLAEGAILTLNNIPFTISYTGGSGNDVVLTVAAPTTVWVNDTWVEDTNVLGGTPITVEYGDIVDSDPGASPSDSFVDNLVFGYNAFATLIDGIAAVTSGGTVNVLAGSYTEGPQVYIGKDLVIDGQSSASVIINPGADTGNAGDARGWFLVDTGYNVDISDVTLDGNGFKVWQAIRDRGTGTIDNVVFNDIQYEAGGPSYAGTAIATFGGVGARDITNSTFTNIGREGVLYYGAGTTGTFSGNTYTGKGAGDWLDYAVEIGAGAQVNISANTITNNLGVASFDLSESAGILITTFYGGGSQATIQNNFITGNTTGVAVGYDGADTSIATISNNDLSGNGLGVSQTGSAVADASGNWWGTTSAAAVAALVSGTVDYTPWLNFSTDTSGAAGFQGDFSYLHVDDDSPQTGATGRIQEGINLLANGALTSGARTVDVKAGSYAENVLVDKILTLDGAGFGANPVVDTVITSAVAGQPVLRVTASGASVGDRLTVKDLRATGATVNGIVVDDALNAISHVTLDHVASVSNLDNGLLLSYPNYAMTDIIVDTPELANNTNAGIQLSDSAFVFDGLQVLGGNIHDNRGNGLITGVANSIGVTNITIDGTTFTGNGWQVGQNFGNIMFYKFEGNATVENVVINSLGAFGTGTYGLQFNGGAATGAYPGTSDPLKSIVIDDVDISGAFRKVAFLVQNYNDVAGFSVNDVDLRFATSSTPGWATLAIGHVDTVNSFNLGNTKTTDLHLWTTDNHPGEVGNVNALNTDFYTAGGVTLLNKAVIADNFAIEDVVRHAVDVGPGLGVARWNAGNTYVTPNSFLSPVTTTPSIQRAVDAATTGDVVHIKTGTYTGSVSTAGKSVTLSPGSSPGQVTLNGDLTLDSNDALTIEINGTNAASEYDNFLINGLVDLGNAALNASRGFAPTVGSTFTLVNNDGADPVTGTFAGLPEGAVLTLASIPFTISYTGGSGNDVVLTVVVPNTVWVNDTWVITNDLAPGGISYGDTVDSNTGIPGDVSVTGKIIGYNAFTTIQGGVDAVASGGTVNVIKGVYGEDVVVSKVVNLIGLQGYANTTIVGTKGDASGNTVYVTSGGVLVQGFTITRDGNNPADWNDANGVLNSQGISFQGVTSGTIRDSLFDGNRNGVYINQSQNIQVLNNIIDNNRTGIQVANDVSGLLVQENQITNNWTLGILFNFDTITQLTSSVTVFNNAIYDNWYGGVVRRWTNSTAILNVSGNWFGTNNPTTSNVNTTEPGYAVQIPTAYGGGASNPGGAPDIVNVGVNRIDYTPWLDAGTDTSPTLGFQGDFSYLHVDDDSPQFGAIGRIQEGINLLANGALTGGTRTVEAESGTYAENVNINKSMTLLGQGSTPADSVISVTSGNAATIAASDVTIQDFRVAGTAATNGVYIDSATSNDTLTNVVSTGHNYGLEIHNAAVVNTLNLNQVSLVNNNVGLRVATTGKVDGLSVNNGTFDNNNYGWDIAANSGSSSNQNDFTNVVFTGASTFSNNVFKGLYAEKLNNANLSGITAIGSGTGASSPSGIDLNLKYGTYTGIALNNVTLTNNGTGSATGTGLAIKGRNDAPYNVNPATVSGVSLTNVAIDGSPIDLSIGNNVTGLTFSNVDLLGAGAGLVYYVTAVDSLNLADTSFAGTLATYIGNASANPIDGTTGATFNGFNTGVGPVAPNLTTYFSIEDKIVDAIDVSGLGLVRLNTGDVFVTPNSFYVPGGTSTPSIQRAVNAAISGDVVHIQTGTYTGNVTTSGKSVTLSPGSSPGQVTLNGDLTLDSDDFVAAEFNGVNPATQYDNFIINGAVSLGSATLQSTAGYTPTFGSTFTLVNNDGADPVVGTFAGLPEGSIINLGGSPFTLSYTGGTGNDVVLTVDTLHVTNFVPNASGFDVTFNRKPTLADLNLYDSLLDGSPVTLAPADITLFGSGGVGNVLGSMVWHEATNTMSFVKTGGVLAPATYTVTLFSGSTRFHDAYSDLDGNYDFVPGDDFTNVPTYPFVIAPSANRVVSVRDFARGPGQTVEDVPGAPVSPINPHFLEISIDNAVGVFNLDVHLTYDPALLHVNSASIAAGLPMGWSVTYNNQPGDLYVTASGPTALGASHHAVVLVNADVPDGAAYGDSEVLRLVPGPLGMLNDDAIPSTPDYAIHKNLYLGDADADGFYSGFDATLISRVVVNLDSGFDTGDWTDPRIIGDTTNNGALSGLDASLVAQKAALLSVPQIPNLPGLVLAPRTAGIDPLLSIATNIAAIPGGTVNVPVNITVPADEAARSAGFDVNYDVTKLAFAGSTEGSFWPSLNNWVLTTNEYSPGHVRVILYNSQGNASAIGTGDIANLQFNVLPATSGVTPLDVAKIDPLNEGGLTWSESDGSVLIGSQVEGRFLFYNQSFFDGSSAAQGASDDLAIATDKTAYLPYSNTLAGFNNVSSFTRGINGIMVDLNGAGNHAAIDANDFVFKVGNDNSPSGWALVTATPTISVRAGAGVSGSDRVTITWASGSIRNEWLEVQVKPTANTGLASTDVFFWGNKIGDTGQGTPPTTFLTSGADKTSVLGLLGSGVGITSVRDFNRDNNVTAADASVVPGSLGSIARLQLNGGPFAPEAVELLGDATELNVIASALSSDYVGIPATESMDVSSGAVLQSLVANAINSTALDNAAAAHAIAFDAEWDELSDGLTIDDELLISLLEGVDS